LFFCTSGLSRSVLSDNCISLVLVPIYDNCVHHSCSKKLQALYTGPLINIKRVSPTSHELAFYTLRDFIQTLNAFSGQSQTHSRTGSMQRVLSIAQKFKGFLTIDRRDSEISVACVITKTRRIMMLLGLGRRQGAKGKRERRKRGR
jgi:hypothetical protein